MLPWPILTALLGLLMHQRAGVLGFPVKSASVQMLEGEGGSGDSGVSSNGGTAQPAAYNTKCQPPMSPSSPSSPSFSSGAARNMTLSPAQIGQSLDALIDQYCGSDPSWSTPLKPNQSAQRTVGNVTAYICNNQGEVRYCDRVAGDIVLRAVSSGCGGSDRPGQTTVDSLIYGFAGPGESICM